MKKDLPFTPRNWILKFWIFALNGSAETLLCTDDKKNSIYHYDQILTLPKNKKTETYVSAFFAEKEGFEPPDLLQSTVFKTAAIDHSAISPVFGLLFSVVQI